MTDVDFQFVDGVVCRAEERKAAAGIDTLSLEEKHATVIWAAIGIIGNGGFQYFFENDLSAEESADAFDAVGLPKVADIFRTALSLFPDGRPQSEWKEALAFIQAKEELFDKLAAQICKSDLEIQSRLAAYLRAAGIR